MFNHTNDRVWSHKPPCLIARITVFDRTKDHVRSHVLDFKKPKLLAVPFQSAVPAGSASPRNPTRTGRGPCLCPEVGGAPSFLLHLLLPGMTLPPLPPSATCFPYPYTGGVPFLPYPDSSGAPCLRPRQDPVSTSRPTSSSRSLSRWFWVLPIYLSFRSLTLLCPCPAPLVMAWLFGSECTPSYV